MSEQVYVYRKRRFTELGLIIVAQVIAFAGYVLIYVNLWDRLPDDWPVAAAVWFGIGIVAHLFVRFRTPYADPTLVPMALLLTGLGLAMIHRLDLADGGSGAATQLIWAGLGVGLMCAVLILFPDHRVLARFPYLLFILGIGLLLLPLAPGIGQSINGSRLWIVVAGYSFQPGEIAKIVLSVAFAAYLVDKRDVLALAGHRVLGLDLPRARDLGPIAIMWVAAVLVLVFQRDLGTSLLFFGLFVVMLYVATERVGWVVLGTLLFAGAAVAGYALFDHVQVRVAAWLDPFSRPDVYTQIINAQFGIDFGGMVGRGWGEGSPWMTTFAKSDMITSAIGEELGMAGLFAVIAVFALFVARGLRTALGARDPFGTLLATGLAWSLGLQTFIIIGGVTRLLPLTGLTTPFMSQGGSSLIANWVIVGVLLVISHQGRRPVAPVAPADVPAAPPAAPRRRVRAAVAADDSPTQAITADDAPTQGIATDDAPNSSGPDAPTEALSVDDADTQAFVPDFDEEDR